MCLRSSWVLLLVVRRMAEVMGGRHRSRGMLMYGPRTLGDQIQVCRQEAGKISKAWVVTRYRR